jgi:hypothetical protein
VDSSLEREPSALVLALAEQQHRGAPLREEGSALLVETLDPDLALGLDPTEVSEPNLDFADDLFFGASELLAGEQRVEHRDDPGVPFPEMNVRA